MRDLLTSLKLILGTSWRLHPLGCVLGFAETLGSTLTALLPTAFGVVVGAIAAHDRQRTWAALALVALALGATHWLQTIGVHMRLVLMEKVGHHFDQEIGRLATEVPTLDLVEDPEFLDRLQAIRDKQGVLGSSYNMMVNAVRSVAYPVVLVLAAVAADWRLGLLALAGLPSLWLTRWITRWGREAEEASGENGRRTEHLMDLALTPTPSAELRVLGARRSFIARLGRSARAWRDPYTLEARRVALAEAGTTAFYYLAAGAVLAWILADAARGRTTPGQLTVALASTAVLSQAFGELGWVVSGMATTLRTVGRLRWLQRYHAEAVGARAGSEPPPERLTHGIVLDDVTFRYPGSERAALDHVSLTLPAGAVVAVVGENGAGKSTLVKALTGMYDLAGGQVLIDGTPLSALDIAAWRERCSGAFQDHLRLEALAVEAVTVGDLPALGSAPRAHQALEAAAATDVLAALPQGLDTQLGPLWDGVDLSGGQWQRLAIARGMMRERPLLLVLDEPTSALDPATEHALFEGYAAAARATGGLGGVTLLVTHRFSTVAAADLVVVLSEGQVAEAGTHAELMARGGAYAELYGLQAAGYR